MHDVFPTLSDAERAEVNDMPSSRVSSLSCIKWVDNEVSSRSLSKFAVAVHHAQVLRSLTCSGVGHQLSTLTYSNFAAQIFADCLHNGRLRKLDLRGVSCGYDTSKLLAAWPLQVDPSGRCRVALASVFNARSGYDAIGPRRVCAFYTARLEVFVNRVHSFENVVQFAIGAGGELVPRK